MAVVYSPTRISPFVAAAWVLLGPFAATPAQAACVITSVSPPSGTVVETNPEFSWVISGCGQARVAIWGPGGPSGSDAIRGPYLGSSPFTFQDETFFAAAAAWGAGASWRLETSGGTRSSAQSLVLDLDLDGDGYSRSQDCNDLDRRVHPGALDECGNGVDEDCDDYPDEAGVDADADRYGPCDGDCDDQDANVYSGAEEACDGLDNDCDGTSDENVQSLFYVDGDRDGYGAAPIWACTANPEAGIVAASGDCDDIDGTLNPGTPEVCDGIDQDCDGTADDGVTGSYYLDGDGDQYGGAATQACPADAADLGLTPTGGDCDDEDAAVNPAGTEVCNGRDDDCSGAAEAGSEDADADGVRVCAGDCDDTLNTVGPGATETCNAVDDDCDGSIDEGNDADADGYAVCDCDDASSASHPGATEVCDFKDNDCDGDASDEPRLGVYYDYDADGYGGSSLREYSCSPLWYWCEFNRACTTKTGDCDDANGGIKPGATESCDGIDQDCNGTADDNPTDADGDGYRLCSDCADSDAGRNPAKSETCNSVDDDCDGSVDEGFDTDLDGWTSCAGDCLDDPYHSYGWYTHPGAYEWCGYGNWDWNCDGQGNYVLYDRDGDGVPTCLGDCDDTKASVKPGATESCNSVDDDCDGSVDEGIDGDGDGHLCGVDCNDASASVHPGAGEACDGVDSDCNGVDCPLLGSLGTPDASLRLVGKKRMKLGSGKTRAHDLDGDGQPEFLVPAPEATTLGQEMGAVYGWFDQVAASDTLATYGFKITGDSGHRMLGMEVEAAGDLNGDGQGDLVITSGDLDRSEAGRAWIFHGPMSRGNHTLAEADATIRGDSQSHLWAVEPLGDVNGDGYDDLAVGAVTGATDWTWNAALGRYAPADDNGVVEIWFGPVYGDQPLGFGDVTFYGAHAASGAGAGLLSGDVDGDGKLDLVVGAPGESWADPVATGALHVCYGPLAASGGDLDTECPDALVSDGTLDELGRSSADDLDFQNVEVADFDGDGRADLAAFGIDADGNALAAACFGPIDGAVSLAECPVQVTGDPDVDHFTAVAAGNLDKSGAPDLVLAAVLDAGSGGKGVVQVYYSILDPDPCAGVPGECQEVAAWHATPDLEIDSGAAAAVAGLDVGDFGDDTIDDIRFAVPTADVGTTDTGAVYVFFGR